MPTIVYLDDDKIQHLLMRKLIKIHFPESQVEFFSSPEDVEVWLQSNHADLILSDLNLDGESAWDWVPNFLKISSAPIIFITGHVGLNDKKNGEKYPQVLALYEKPLADDDWREIVSSIS